MGVGRRSLDVENNGLAGIELGFREDGRVAMVVGDLSDCVPRARAVIVIVVGVAAARPARRDAQNDAQDCE